MTPKQANSVGKMDFNITGDELNLSANLGYNFDVDQQTWDSSGNLQLDIDGSIQQDLGLGLQELAAKIDFDLITLKNKIFFKLNTLDISKPAENPSIAMIQQLSAPYLEKWYFLEDSLGEMQNASVNMLVFEEKFYNILNTQRLFNHVATQENQNYYDYEVDINSETIINIAQEINNLAGMDEANQLTQQDFDMIKQDIADFNQQTKINIRIDKENTQHFIMTFTDENATFTIENTKENLNFLFLEGNSDTKVEIIGTKNLTGLSNVITVKHADIDVLNGTLDISKNGKNTNMDFQAVTNQDQQEIEISMTLEDTTMKKDINITPIEDATDFQEVIMQTIWGMMNATYVDESTSFEDEFNEEFNYSQVEYDEESTGIIYE